jgi:hypothetical protein
MHAIITHEHVLHICSDSVSFIACPWPVTYHGHGGWGTRGDVGTRGANVTSHIGVSMGIGWVNDLLSRNSGTKGAGWVTELVSRCSCCSSMRSAHVSAVDCVLAMPDATQGNDKQRMSFKTHGRCHRRGTRKLMCESCSHIGMCLLYIYIYIHISVYLSIYIYIVHTYSYSTHKCMDVYTCNCNYIYIYIYMYACTYMHHYTIHVHRSWSVRERGYPNDSPCDLDIGTSAIT